MKFFVIFCCLSTFVVVVHCQDCGSDARWATEGYGRQFSCSTEGIKTSFAIPGCVCNNFDDWYNTKTQKCEPPKCENMDCAGRENEAFFSFESGSRNRCECTAFITRDSNTGCMCKNGFCQKDNKCVKRDCVHPVYN